MATLNRADVYGMASGAGASIQTSAGLQVSGPNQSAVTGGSQGNPVTNVGGNAASAFSWVGFMLALVILRIALEAGGESR